MPLSKEKLGNLITQIDKRNKNTQLGIDCVRGISVKKVFTATKADLYGVSLNNYKIVPPQESRISHEIFTFHTSVWRLFIVFII